ncbi:MAG: hypothetical protein KGJ86_10990 [Chloroflexota bacterium]|nr:hypothetical protein [Chloroflexota bacterium]
MAGTAALRLSPRDFGSLWEAEDPDLVLDTDDGQIHPVRHDGNEPSRLASIASGAGKAVATVAPVAVGAALSELSRWD